MYVAYDSVNVLGARLNRSVERPCKFAHVVVATLYNRVDTRDELEIRVKSDAQVSGSWCGRDVIAKDILKERRMQSLCDGTYCL